MATTGTQRAAASRIGIRAAGVSTGAICSAAEKSSRYSLRPRCFRNWPRVSSSLATRVGSAAGSSSFSAELASAMPRSNSPASRAAQVASSSTRA